ncbi:proton-coupled folate transporter-like [Oppia nitens]|uniref:proton-coupled folate transporter-like n=1 Tax=Oppia nitens TaxID=1686743 RepID=UPI0023DA4055|nr:proton-coupled folate transporter-like [Oppia nitens]
MKSVPAMQLAQDKLCLYHYQMPGNYCREFSQMPSDPTKLAILADFGNFQIYGILVIYLPSFIMALFIGSWSDKYLSAKKLIMINSAIAIILESIILILCDYFAESSIYLMLLIGLPNLISGGLMGSLGACWTYLVTTTPGHMRAMRITVAEVIMGLSGPLGSYLGGYIINTPTWLSSGVDHQLHNSTAVFIIDGLVYGLSILWIWWAIDEARDIRNWELEFGLPYESDGLTVDQRVAGKLENYDKHRESGHSPVRLLFTWSNLKNIWHTCAKSRPNYVRLQIWLLFLANLCYMIVKSGPVAYLMPFTQTVYKWDSSQYSTGVAITNLSETVVQLLASPVLIMVLKLKDTTVSALGMASYGIQNLVRGLVLTPDGFYYSIIAGCLGSIASVGLRSHFSRILKPRELGALFSCFTCIEGLTPIVAGVIFNEIFKHTVQTGWPGCMLLVAAGIQNLVRGLVLTPDGFYYSIIAGCFWVSIASVGLRSHFSRILKPQ